MERLLLALICHLVVASPWVLCLAETPPPTTTTTTTTTATYPNQCVNSASNSTFGTYPNPLNITQHDRDGFHPVMKFPAPSKPQPAAMDLTTCADGIAPQSQRHAAQRRHDAWHTRILRRFTFVADRRTVDKIGKYDEDRQALYATQHFLNADIDIDGYRGARTIHLGIDLMARVGTPVYAFADGVVHAMGYNAALGDYGNVVVVQHALSGNRTLWALYGHLGELSCAQQIRKGQMIGRIGDVHENGGWVAPHLHFQLSMHAPETHDMPGAASREDRERALTHYPDPRYVLGPIY